jgi:enoyl-CoA hydratase/carnithine racemase
MTYDFRHIKVTTQHGVATLLLSRPQQLNAMNRLIIEEATLAFDALNQDPNVRAIIFSGEGRAFCAGDDRKEHVHPKNEQQARSLVDAIQRVTRSIMMGSKPVVGAINGWAVGGGFEWAINCDFPIWARSARGFFPEVSLNLFVTGGVTSLLPALVGLNKAREMLFLGEKYSADELLEMGIAWKVVDDDDLILEANEVAQKLAQLPELSVRAMKKTLNETAFSSIDAAMELETEATIQGFMDPLTTEKLRSF